MGWRGRGAGTASAASLGNMIHSELVFTVTVLGEETFSAVNDFILSHGKGANEKWDMSCRNILRMNTNMTVIVYEWKNLY
jgi:hypothetical protein